MKSIFGVVFGVAIVASMVVVLLFGAVSVADAMGGSGTKWGNHDKGGKGCCTEPKPTSVPEPSTFILFGSMMIGALVVKKVITWDN